MRYFTELSYNGKNYNGWQRQPNAPSVQEAIEIGLSTILREQIGIIGCGRTDSGVHARQFFLHFDIESELPEAFLPRLNKFLAADIAIKRIFKVADNLHARFDATYRAYEYHIDFNKNPFKPNTIYHFPFARKLDFEKVKAAGDLLKQYNSFFPFCKTNTDVKTMDCDLFRSDWVYQEKEERLVFYIAANRFLRGMVRLIVGMCLNVGLGKLRLDHVKIALEEQERLKKSWSVPPHGLFLTRVDYKDLG